jgi:hypothetical protein
MYKSVNDFMVTSDVTAGKILRPALGLIIASLAPWALAGSIIEPEKTAGDLGTPVARSGMAVAELRPQIRLYGASQPYDHGDPTTSEQYMMELVNRARANPAAEAARLGIDLNQGLDPGTINSAPKQPLAFNRNLIQSARGHSQWMLDTDTFSHTGSNGNNPYDRMVAAGYPFVGSWMLGENIAWKGTTGTFNVNEYTATLHDNLFKSPYHRENLMENGFDELGIGLIQGVFTVDGVNYNSLMCAQNFAASDGTPGPLVLGVIYRDANANHFYDPGEGLTGVRVTPSTGNYYAVSSSSGGYAVPYSGSGTVTITFSGGGLSSPVAKTVVTTGVNIKLDLDPGQLAQFIRSTTRWSPQNGFQARISGTSGLQVSVEYTLDLAGWQPLGTYTLVNGSYDFQDRNATATQPRAYRLR